MRDVVQVDVLRADARQTTPGIDLVLTTLFFALSGRFKMHRRLA